MFGAQTQLKATPKRVNEAVKKGAYSSFFHAAASIRKAAIESIMVSDDPSHPGEPVHTRRGRGGRLAKRAIFFKVDKAGAVIGFVFSRIGQVMQIHEHGGRRDRVRYPSRPVMHPALERNLARFHREWKGAI